MIRFVDILQKFRLLLLLIAVCTLGFARSADCASITSVRVGQGVGNVRIVIDADSELSYKVFLLNEPRRLVIDTKDSVISPDFQKTITAKEFVSSIRVGDSGAGGVRLAFDLLQPVVVKKKFSLPPQSSFSWRFVLDTEPVGAKEFAANVGNDHAVSSGAYEQNITSSKHNTVMPAPLSAKRSSKKIVVLDPGHGGVDPGAIGVSGVYEKNITLAMARELKAELDKSGKYTVYLTRNRDIFIPLRDRVKISRRHNADLFLSIHADSAANKRASGLSVYTLSEKASDKEAAALAEKENKADILAGMDFAEHTREVADVLLSLAQRDTRNRSSEFASALVQEMRKSTHTLDNTHRFAGFAVLKAPDVPSVLMELGYLSNRTEEKQLQQKSHRKKLAVSTVKAIDKYFDMHASSF